MTRVGLVLSLMVALGACDPDDGVADDGQELEVATDDGAEEADDDEQSDGANGDGANDDGSSDDGSSDDGGTTGGDGTDDGEGSDGGDASVFQSEIVPVLQARCGCHTGGSPSAGLDLSPAAAYDALVEVPSSSALPYVTPGSAEQSYLAHKMQGTHLDVAGGGGSLMPPGEGTIPAEEIEAVVAWIDAGALP